MMRSIRFQWCPKLCPHDTERLASLSVWNGIRPMGGNFPALPWSDIATPDIPATKIVADSNYDVCLHWKKIHSNTIKESLILEYFYTKYPLCNIKTHLKTPL